MKNFRFFIFFIFFFNWLSKNIYVTLERSNFSRFNTKKLRQLLLFFQRRRFRLLVFFNGKRKRERECAHSLVRGVCFERFRFRLNGLYNLRSEISDQISLFLG